MRYGDAGEYRDRLCDEDLKGLLEGGPGHIPFVSACLRVLAGPKPSAKAGLWLISCFSSRALRLGGENSCRSRATAPRG
jgi:hypothetical protein